MTYPTDPYRNFYSEAELSKLRAAQKRFPIMGGPSIPWSMIAPYEGQAKRNHDQTLQRLAERGGLSPGEALCTLDGRKLVFSGHTKESLEAERVELVRRLAEYEGPMAENAALRERVATWQRMHETATRDAHEFRVERDALREKLAVAVAKLAMYEAATEVRIGLYFLVVEDGSGRFTVRDELSSPVREMHGLTRDEAIAKAFELSGKKLGVE